MFEDIIDKANITEEAYKLVKEQFVSGFSGGTIYEVLLLCLTWANLFGVLRACSALFPFYFAPVTAGDRSTSKTDRFFLLARQFLLEFALCCFPIFVVVSDTNVVWYTIFSQIVYVLLAIGARAKTKVTKRITEEELQVPHKPFISTFRFAVMLPTIVCILAVDFQVFPRRYCKTEISGFSLMDVGVGFTIICLGLIRGTSRSAIATQSSIEAKRSSLPPWLLTQINLTKKAIASSLPLIIIGATRTVVSKLLKYQEHVSEYGVHWNFFLTISVMMFLAAVIPLHPKFSLIAFIVITIVQEFLLKTFLYDWVKNAERTNFVSKNKEGLTSLIGYYALFIFGQYLGYTFSQMGTATQETVFEKRSSLKKWIVSACVLIFGGLAGTVFTSHFAEIIPSMRAVVNVTYILFNVSLCSVLLGASLAIQLIVPLPRQLPKIIAGINRNMLVLFLIANLMTSGCTFAIRTVFASDFVSRFVVYGYTFVILLITFVLETFNIRIKLHP